MWQTSKLLLIVLGTLFFMVSPSFAKVEITKSNGVTNYQFSIDNVDFSKVELEKQIFTRPSLKGVDGFQGIFGKVGFPELPTVSFFVRAQSDKDIKVTLKEMRAPKSRQSVALPIAPLQESLPKIKGATAPFVMDRTAYETSVFLPLNKFQISEAGSVKGVKQYLVTVYPFSYNPKSGQYRLTSNFDVAVKDVAEVESKGVETFVFVIGSQFKDHAELQKYMEFKKELGYHIEKIVVGQDANTPEEIRAKLKEIYSNPEFNLEYALIIGDIEDVPAKQSSTLSNSKYVSDHYYRAIDTENYVDDINGPDIGVGRVTVKNAGELNGVLAKFFKYQKGQFGRTDWFNKLSFLATDDRWQVAEGTHNYAVDNFFAPHGYLGNYPNEVQNGGDKLYAITYKVTKPQVIDRIQEGRFIINYSGHGATTYWDAPNFTQTDVRNLHDPDVLPFVISNACITGQFIIDESYAETWIKHPYGAILYWGSMDSSYWDEDDILEKALYHGLFDEGRRSFSSLTQNALAGVWKHYNGANRSKYYWETYTIFGDPSIDLRMSEPKMANLNVPDALPYGLNEVTASLTDLEGNPLSNVRVAISHVEGNFTFASLTNEAGEVTLPLKDAMVADHFKVIAYGKDLVLQEKEIFVSSPDYPFYVLKNYNNNGQELRIQPNQKFNLGFSVENVSPIASTGGKVTIESVSEGLEIVNNEIALSAIAGNSVVKASGLMVRVLPDVAHQGSASINLRWTSNEGQSFTTSTQVKIVKSEINIVGVDFGDADHPGDNGFEPGGQGNIYLTIKNNGSFPVENAILNVKPLSTKFTTSGVVRIDRLEVGETKRFGTSFDAIFVDLSDESQNDDVLAFSLFGKGESAFGHELLESTSSFVVGKYGYRDVNFEDIGLALVDQGTANYDFSGLEGLSAIKDLRVHVKIQHTYVGDLTLTLFHPSGASIILRKKVGGSNDDIDEEYGPDALNAFDGLPTDGVWRLEINDSSKSDTGFLNGLSLSVKGFL